MNELEEMKKEWMASEKKDDVSIKKFDKFISEWVEQKAKVKEAERVVDEYKGVLGSMKEKLEAYFTELGYKSFRTPDGLISVVEKTRYNSPSGENKDALHAYLRSAYPNEWESYLSVNSQKLQTFIKGEIEKHGEDFVVPGCEAKYEQKILQWRKK